MYHLQLQTKKSTERETSRLLHAGFSLGPLLL
jgi:hypothetical protein